MTKTITYNPQPLVEEFHRVYGQPIRTEYIPLPPEASLRHSLIKEETEELFKALREDDFVEVIDALGDIVYVVAGAAITYGLALEPITLPVLSDGAVPFLDSQDSEIVGLLLSFVDHFGNYTESVESPENLNKDGGDLLAIFNAMVSICFSLAWLMNVNLGEILDEIQLSNMSKLDTDGKVLRREDGKILKGPNWFAPRIKEQLKSKGWVTVD